MAHVSLVAYIPVLNRRHLDWFKRHQDVSGLYLISQGLAVSLVPRQARNIGALTTLEMVSVISSLRVGWVEPLYNRDFQMSNEGQFIVADEDVSQAFAEKYLNSGHKVVFESIWARYDMSAVKRLSPVMADVEVTSEEIHRLRIEVAKKVASKSPDLWRQIGAALFVGNVCVATAFNQHYPTEYEQDMFGDPRINVDAGQISKYLSLHSEEGVVTFAARKGISTLGAILYATVFPCENCARVIVGAGIKEVYFEEGYSALNSQEILRVHGVRMIQVQKDPVA